MTNLALVLGGHASLGAYTAGALTEILFALEDDRGPEAPRVSVVTGSGSGALSAALAARSLVVNPGLVPWIERIWVDALDAGHLLGSGRPDRSSLLDPSPLEELTLHTVAGGPAADDRTAAALGEELRVGLCLVPADSGRGRSRGPGGPVAETRAPDPARGADDGDPEETPGDGAPPPDAAAVFRLRARHSAGDPVWGKLRRALLAAASAPMALPARELDGDALSASGRGGAPEPGRYTGSGGGRPRPLGLARELMRRPGVGDDGPWRVLVVDPDPPRPRPSLDGTLLREADVLLRRGLGDEMARDWRAAEDAAGRTELLRSLVARLPEIHGRMDDPDAVGLGRRIGELAEEVAERDARQLGGDDGERPGDPVIRRLDDRLRRIQDHPAYAKVFGDVETRAGRTRLAKLIYVLEAVADLQGADPTRLHRIAPDEPEGLAGRGLAGYGGFAAREWRRHDFAAGRRDARRVLEDGLSDLVAYRPDAADAYDPGAVRPLASALDRGQRRRLRSRLEGHADRVVDGLQPGGAGWIFFRLARPAVREKVVDRIMATLEPPAAG